MTARELFALSLRIAGLVQLTMGGEHLWKAALQLGWFGGRRSWDLQFSSGQFAFALDTLLPAAYAAWIGLTLVALAWPLSQWRHGADRREWLSSPVVVLPSADAHRVALRLLAAYLLIRGVGTVYYSVNGLTPSDLLIPGWYLAVSGTLWGFATPLSAVWVRKGAAPSSSVELA